MTGISTLYLPPVAKPELDREMAMKLGLIRTAAKPAAPSAAVATAPPQRMTYQPVADTSRLAEFLIELSVNPGALLAYQQDPQRTSLINADLDKTERAALLSGHGGRIRMAIRAGSTRAADVAVPLSEVLKTVPVPDFAWSWDKSAAITAQFTAGSKSSTESEK